MTREQIIEIAVDLGASRRTAQSWFWAGHRIPDGWRLAIEERARNKHNGENDGAV